MGIFDGIFKRKQQSPDAAVSSSEQAVIVRLDCTSLPDAVYEDYDLATLGDRLAAVIEESGSGEFDGHEVGPNEATVYMYGPDAEGLFSVVEPVLREYPLCRNAVVEVRLGGPGADQREVRLPTA